jgi:hypothetical protein
VPIRPDATISLTLHAALKLMKNGHLRNKVCGWNKFPISNQVIPAQAGNQNSWINWFPACAGMTITVAVTAFAKLVRASLVHFSVEHHCSTRSFQSILNGA